MTVAKIERLMNLLIMLLETPRPVTVKQIREQVPGYGQEAEDAFRRMFERDKAELREMGIPIEQGPTDVWEEESGYVVPKDLYYLPEIEFDAEEHTALWLAAQLLKLQDPGAARTALLKLGVNIAGTDPESRLSWLAVDAGLSMKGLGDAFQAVADRKRVAFRYQSKGEEKRRKLEPYGLTQRRGVWYLIGYDHDSKAVRSFRLDRMTSPIRQSDPAARGPEYEIPEGFKPGQALEIPPFAQSDDEVMQARVRFSPEVAWLVERQEPWLPVEPQADGSLEANVSVSDTRGFLSWVLWYGLDAEIISPNELRSEIRRRLEDLCG